MRSPAHVSNGSARERDGLIVPEIGAGEADAPPGVDRVSILRTEGFGATSNHRNPRRLVVDIDPVVAGTAYCEGEIRRVDLDRIVRIHRPHAQANRPLRHFVLFPAVVESHDRHTRSGCDAERGAAHLELRARIGCGPQSIADPQRTVQLRLYPVGRARRQKAHLTGHVTEPHDTAGRIGSSAACHCHQQGYGDGRACAQPHSVLVHVRSSIRPRAVAPRIATLAADVNERGFAAAVGQTPIREPDDGQCRLGVTLTRTETS